MRLKVESQNPVAASQSPGGGGVKGSESAVGDEASEGWPPVRSWEKKKGVGIGGSSVCAWRA